MVYWRINVHYKEKCYSTKKLLNSFITSIYEFHTCTLCVLNAVQHYFFCAAGFSSNEWNKKKLNENKECKSIVKMVIALAQRFSCL